MDASKSFFRPGGTMDPSAPSYIERQADADLFAALSSGEYVFVLDSRQKGKSSLVARAMVKLRERGIRTVKLDLQRIGANVTTEQWYAGLLSEIGDELVLSDEVFAYWRDQQAVGPLARWIGALRDVVLPKLDVPLVVFIDEVDFVRALPFATDEFFAAIRDCFNRRSEAKGFERLTFCLVGVATPGQLIRNPEITPFNIGRRIDLADFEVEDTNSYAKKLDGPNRDGTKLMARVHYWLSGHPYLTQLLCSHIEANDWVHTKRDVDTLVRRIFLTPEGRQREPNFADVERRLLDPDVPGLSPEERRIQVLELYGKMLKGQRIETREENPIVATLRLAGVGLEDRRALALRNRLYRMVFDERWRRSSLPDAELRRQRGAARLAVLRTAAVAGLVLTMVSALAVRSQFLSTERAEAMRELSKRTEELGALNAEQTATLNELRRQEADLMRVSDERERSIDSLEERTRELREVSSEREEYLAKVTKSANDLRGLSDERARIIQNLEQKTAALTRQTYNTRMANISLGLQMGDSMRVKEELRSLSHVKNAPFELGHARLRAVPPEFVAEVPRISGFETGGRGSLEIVSDRGRFQLGASGDLKEVSWSRLVDPSEPTSYNVGVLMRRGHYRVWRWLYDDSLRDVIADAATNKSVMAGERGRRVYDIDERGNLYISRTNDARNVVQVRRIPTNDVTLELSIDGPILDARFTRSGGVMVMGETELRRFDAQGVQVARSKLGSGEVAVLMEWAPDRTKLAFAITEPTSGDSWVELRDADSLETSYRSSRVKAAFSRVIVSANNQRVAAGAHDGRIFELNVESNQPSREIFQMSTACSDLLYRGNRLYSLSLFGELAAWQSPVPPASWSNPDAEARTAAVLDDGRSVAWIDEKWVWHKEDILTGERRSLALPIKGEGLVGPTVPIASISWRTPYTYFPGPNGTVGRLDHDSLEIVYSKPVSNEQLSGVSILSGGRLLCWKNTIDAARAASLRKFAVLDAATFAVRFRYETPTLAQFDRVGRLLQVDVGGRSLTLRSQETGDPVARLNMPMEVIEASLSADGKRAAVTFRKPGQIDYPNAEIWLYEVPSMRRIGTLTGPRGPYWRPNFSPDGRRFWALNNQGDLQLFDVERKTRIRPLGDSKGRVVRNFAGDRLAGVIASQELRIWDVETGDELMTLPMRGKQGSLWVDRNRTEFSRDGKTLVAVGNDGALHVFFSEPISPKPAAGTPRKPAP
jgi:WD40 repeat protein